MTVDYSRVAVYDVRNAMWLELQNANLFNSRDYTAEGFNDPLVPIIPSQQVPEFNNLLPGKTYITYHCNTPLKCNHYEGINRKIR